ncbi:BTB/POZ DOMAIN-CONTAINING PROTEIN NPY2 [Salix koriyanagi]|uniref:BTB/POZ DOMAIN-CONTAINING PROTEIN NPY2 n=1 Tax=Salix koriyanagi TaxID=2511006 RepID=A0A9Q1AMV7_9ROSI|nr:BTB/POZ DOMAIN-CONTAINING PROTEIN NPY2 [Salix koriyanagi]
MKFMKLGSKSDSFQTDGNSMRYVAAELATDIIVDVGDIKFYLHKFPLLSKSGQLQKLVMTANGENSDEVDISDIPGGPSAFEICAKFCYGMTVTINAYNVVATRCAAEYLGMHETVEKGNLIYKIDVFLSSSIFRSWKDSIIVLQTTRSLLPLSEELEVISHCIDAIAAKACVDVSKVDWSYSYNRKNLPEENGIDSNLNGLRKPRVVTTIRTKAIHSDEVIGEALKAYAYRRLPGFSKGTIQSGQAAKYRSIVDIIVWLLPAERGSVSCSFLLKLLKAAIYADFGDTTKGQLIKKIGQQLEEASVNDLLIRAGEGENMMYDVDSVKKMVEEFLVRDQIAEIESEEGHEVQEIRKPGILSDASKLMVVKLIDGYLAEIAKDPNLPLLKFIELAEMVSGISRPAHDALYRAVDMYLKEHPGISKGERKRICKLMDCKKLSVDACMHAMQNDRLPSRVVVQVLFFEQVRAAASSGSSTPDLPKSIRDLNNGSQRSSRSTTANTEEDWDAVATAEELKALKEEVASLRLANGRNGVDKAASNKLKGMLKSKKIFTKLWSNKGEKGENSGSDSSESPGSANIEEAKSTPSRNRRYSVS